MIKNAAKIGRDRDYWDHPKHRQKINQTRHDENGSIVPRDPIEKLEEAPTWESMGRRGCSYGYTYSWAPIRRYLSKQVGKKFKLSEVPVKLRPDISKMLTNGFCYVNRDFIFGQEFYLDNGILRKAERPTHKYRRPISLPYMVPYQGLNYALINGIWYSVTGFSPPFSPNHWNPVDPSSVTYHNKRQVNTKTKQLLEAYAKAHLEELSALSHPQLEEAKQIEQRKWALLQKRLCPSKIA